MGNPTSKNYGVYRRDAKPRLFPVSPLTNFAASGLADPDAGLAEAFAQRILLRPPSFPRLISTFGSWGPVGRTALPPCLDGLRRRGGGTRKFTLFSGFLRIFFLPLPRFAFREIKVRVVSLRISVRNYSWMTPKTRRFGTAYLTRRF